LIVSHSAPQRVAWIAYFAFVGQKPWMIPRWSVQ
jgi:hypothetical protein